MTTSTSSFSTSYSSPTRTLHHRLNIFQIPITINKQQLHDNFYSTINTQKRNWFFKHFFKTRHQIQTQFYSFLQNHNIQIPFFDWFEIYAKEKGINYPFFSYNKPVQTSNNKINHNLNTNTSPQTINTLTNDEDSLMEVFHKIKDPVLHKNLFDHLFPNSTNVLPTSNSKNISPLENLLKEAKTIKEQIRQL